MDSFSNDEANVARETLRKWALGRRDIEQLRAFGQGDNASPETDGQVRLAIMGLVHFSTFVVTQLGSEVLETAPPDLQIKLFERLSIR